MVKLDWILVKQKLACSYAETAMYMLTQIEKMTIGLITGADRDSIYVMIIRNTSIPHSVGDCYPVNPEHFDIIDIKRKRLSQDEKSILNILSKKCIDCVDGSGRTKYNVPILEIINGQNLSYTLIHSDRFYDLKEPLFTY